MSDTEKHFYREVLGVIDHLTDKLVDDIASGKVDPLTTDIEKEYKILSQKEFTEVELKALKEIIREKIIEVIHSLFISIDGGTALSDSGKVLDLIDKKTNKPLTNGALHENFMEVVLENCK